MKKGFLQNNNKTEKVSAAAQQIEIRLCSGKTETLSGPFNSLEVLLKAAIGAFGIKDKVGSEFIIVKGTEVVDSATDSSSITGPLTLVQKTITPTDEPPPLGDDSDSDGPPPLADSSSEENQSMERQPSSSSEEDDDAV